MGQPFGKNTIGHFCHNKNKTEDATLLKLNAKTCLIKN